MPLYTDQLNRTISLSSLPQRIVSLVPSQTELLFDLGLDRELVGVTRFCTYPAAGQQTKEKVGGTKNLNLEKIRLLHPDLILANKEENTKEQIEELSKNYPVWISDVHDLISALNMIACVGKLCGKEQEATTLSGQIESRFAALKMPVKKLRTCYLIWRKPFMTVGGDTFIHQMMQYAGFENVCSHLVRYPSIDLETLELLNTEAILLSSEPYPFTLKHADEICTQLKGIRIELVDGTFFSWYGSRLLQTPAYLEQCQANLGITVM